MDFLDLIFISFYKKVSKLGGLDTLQNDNIRKIKK